MKFPLSTLDRDWYYSEIYKLIQDKECSIIVDTNILATLFRLHDSARAEFFDWIDPLLKSSRIKTPVWALNEYTKRFIRRQTNEYLSAGKKLSTINKEFAEIKKFLMMHVDPATLPKIGYEDQENYTNDLEVISLKLQKLADSVRAKKLDYIVKVHKELEARFGETVLPSDIFNILDRVSLSGPNRYRTELPPGFKDGEKEFNAHGDLIIWQEIMDYVKVANQKKLIILTNDSKQDWLYSPLEIQIKGKIKGNTEFKIADTRLVYEFNLSTGSDELYIINFEQLTQLLIDNGHNDLFQLAKSLQLVREENQTLSVKEPEYELEPVDDKSVDAEIKNPKENQTVSDDPPAALNSTSPYNREALADRFFTNYKQSKIGQIVSELKLYDWYIQNPAVIQAKVVLQAKLDNNDLFILGRNIYQAACGGAYSAIQFLEEFVSIPTTVNVANKVSLAAGMFYEIYFDSNAEFRRNKFKAAFMDLIFSLQTDPNYKGAVDFITEQLSDYSHFLLVVPSAKPPIITFLVKFGQVESPWGSKKCIKSVKVEGEELLQENDGSIITMLSTLSSLQEIQEEIMRVLAVPISQQAFVFEPNLLNDENFLVESGLVLWRGELPSSNRE